MERWSKSMYSQIDLAIMLMCMTLKSDDLCEHKPLTFSEWSKLAKKLLDSEKDPEALLNMKSDELLIFLDNDNASFERYQYLLGRGNKLSNELTTLSDVGIKVLTRGDTKYPKILKSKLNNACPPLWFYAGNIEILESKGISIVGSREIDENDSLITAKLAEKIVKDKYTLVSGGAKGIDSQSEQAALDINGKVISIISDSLIGKIRKKDFRENISKGNILIMSPFGYDSHFSVGNAMARNKYIYALSEKAIVIKSSLETGGTWAGAIEAAKKKLTDIIVIEGTRKNSGNSVLAENYKLPILRKSDVLDAQKSFLDLVTGFEASREIVKIIEKETSQDKEVKYEKLKLDI